MKKTTYLRRERSRGPIEFSQEAERYRIRRMAEEVKDSELESEQVEES